MKLGVLKESYQYEKRVGLTPDVAKKISDLGFVVTIEKGAGVDAGYLDDMYEKAGVTIEKDRQKVLASSDFLVSVSPLTASDIALTKKGATLLGVLKPFKHNDLLPLYNAQNLTTFSLEMLPRITRAQTMDILSSQSNLAGYRAVLEAAFSFGRALPLMMTAAGTIPAARVLILGAGVAGLQAIATARRLGAIVSAFDVRAAAKEQVQSLGATFIEVDAAEIGDGAGGYAKEMSDEYKAAQMEKLASFIKTQDIVITTALIPGKTAPTLITEEMVKSMRANSIIVDLASENGGNCVLSEHGKTVTKHNVKIHAPGNILSGIAADASQFYARNVLAFLKGIATFDEGAISIDWSDEIVSSTLLTKEGTTVHQFFKQETPEEIKQKTKSKAKIKVDINNETTVDA
ncbi:MAG: Re/Si-specific NAD(P)(+) transhydrogenase subunit alpha [Pseudomonadota bacterium]